jgi:hypothetical protein
MRQLCAPTVSWAVYAKIVPAQASKSANATPYMAVPHAEWLTPRRNGGDPLFHGRPRASHLTHAFSRSTAQLVFSPVWRGGVNSTVRQVRARPTIVLSWESPAMIAVPASGTADRHTVDVASSRRATSRESGLAPESVKPRVARGGPSGRSADAHYQSGLCWSTELRSLIIASRAGPELSWRGG